MGISILFFLNLYYVKPPKAAYEKFIFMLVVS
jgi:hypothetical protein